MRGISEEECVDDDHNDDNDHTNGGSADPIDRLNNNTAGCVS